jgi:hypothetical protein
MKSILSSVAIFAAGVATGGFIVWSYLKPKFEEAIEKAINEMSPQTENEPAEIEYEDASSRTKQMEFSDYKNIVKDSGYNNELQENKRPYVITPEQLGDMDYDLVEFTLYSDGILADETGEAIDDEDLEEWVGRQNLDRIGEYEKDILYIRNENQGTDYVICRDLGTYADVTQYDPYAND